MSLSWTKSHNNAYNLIYDWKVFYSTLTVYNQRDNDNNVDDDDTNVMMIILMMIYNISFKKW